MRKKYIQIHLKHLNWSYSSSNSIWAGIAPTGYEL